MFDTAVIMAGGKGTRMFPVSDYVPKPLIRIYDKPLIDHCIDNLTQCGITNIYVTYGYKSELLTAHVERRVAGLINTIGQDNAYFLSNTIVKNITDPIIVMPCDIMMTFKFDEIYKEYSNTYSGAMACILPVKYKPGMNPDFIRHDSSHKITEIGRSFKTDDCASGLQIVTPYLVNTLISKSMTNWNDVWQTLITNKRLYQLSSYAENWETFDKLEQLLTTNVTP